MHAGTHLGQYAWEGALKERRVVLQVASFRKRLEKVVGDKHEEVMGRMGAIMATGSPTAVLTQCSCGIMFWLGSAGCTVHLQGVLLVSGHVCWVVSCSHAHRAVERPKPSTQ